MTSLEQKVISMYDDQDMSTYQIAKELETYPNKIRRILIRVRPKRLPSKPADLNTPQKAERDLMGKG